MKMLLLASFQTCFSKSLTTELSATPIVSHDFKKTHIMHIIIRAYALLIPFQTYWS